MQIFLLGKTKVGKTSLVNNLKEILNEKNISTYEAGAWARKEYAENNNFLEDEMSNDFKNNLTNFALNKLQINPYYSLEKYLEWKKNVVTNNNLIIGVRNPDDLLLMLKEDSINKIVFIRSKKQYTGSLELFEEGLQIIENYIDWKIKLYGNNDKFKVIKIDEEEINNKEVLTKFKEWL